MKIGKAISGLWNANKNYFKSAVESRKINVQTEYDYTELYDIVHKESEPCFVLSTGRCGTALLTKILEGHSAIDVHHMPIPELVYFSKFAYENHKRLSKEIKYLIDAARYDQIRNSFLLKKTFIETNNRITFFASQLAELYPKAKFIHLIRNPINFIKSGVARNWYTGKNPHDEGHIILNHDLDVWNNYSQTEKIAWLWNETNQFIEDFKKTKDTTRVMTIFAEDLFKDPETVINIFNFIDKVPFSATKIDALIKTPVNKSNAKKIESVNLTTDEHLINLLSLSENYNYSI